MSNIIEKKITDKGIILPPRSKSLANYLPYVISGNYVFISGQLPMWEDKVRYMGRVGVDLDIKESQSAARLCTMNMLSVLKEACREDLERVQKCINLKGYLNCDKSFKEHSKVMDGASDTLFDIFENVGKHSRSVVGVTSLPLGAAVEIEGTFFIR